MGEVCRFSVSGDRTDLYRGVLPARILFVISHENNKGIPYRFYRIAWVYLFLILCLEVVLLVQYAF